MARSKQLLYVGTHRYIAAIEPKTGEEVWRTKLPHGGLAVPSILIKGDYLFVGHSGRVYCLSRRFGELLWENGLPRMGYQTIVLAMEGAEGTTSHVAAATASDRRRRAAAAGGAGGGAAAAG